MRFTQAELQQFRDRTVPDLLPDPLRLLFIGINPGLWTAATGAHFARRGIGISNLVPRASARADELTAEELAAAPARLDALVAAHAPAVVAVLGVTAYRQAFGRPKAALGEQETPWPGTRLFVAPNPSGLNAHATLDSLAADYRAAGAAAGLVD
ncbi:mismatch-specific DNA-glycosylase [Micrococcus sp. EYE_162]|uniref:uracil-DNA glycosylase family protein n=1 Tax=unclassified Micrococcus TaxID=2620948 RepID=UPI002006AFF2|nr:MULTISPECIES: uracil-DNA glycosylase family protein [unclassified Micrococcus]MCK6095910.1 mismatch-specific DNA-glycosylase [Micrococcus sp. EYE_212]MCK6172001.1 mismatch-specific DNA-glycosylase [Micrococcus sp. EYE_162]